MVIINKTMYQVKIPKILFLALGTARFYYKGYYNTNDLAGIANKYAEHLVRLRSDKKDYKYLDDTNFGGLRGNFSTLLTWKGFVKRGNAIVSRYYIGRDKRLANAVCNGEIILNESNMTAYTTNEKLKELLELEAWLFTVKETQAHIKVMLGKDKSIPLSRDNDNFKKVSVVRSANGQYFIRSLVNNFIDSKNKVLEYSIVNFWEGKKLKKKNLHPLIVIPTKDNPWSKIFAIKMEDLIDNKPLTLLVDLEKEICFDTDNNKYKLYSLREAVDEFTTGDENIPQRLSYSWEKIKEAHCDKEADFSEIKEDEFIIFLEKFLKWQKEFEVGEKKVVGVNVSSSGGPDVHLTFSGGTTQKLELEHNWKSYLDHRHHESNAWVDTWLFAEEEWNPKRILSLYKTHRKTNGQRIPNVFLCLERGERKCYEANWDEETFTEIPLKF